MKNNLKRILYYGLCLLMASTAGQQARGEAMLSLFNLTWTQVTQKMPEIAEAGYDSIWLPPPAKAGSVFSIGYDCFDPFDLGDKNQRGTTPTFYGTKAQLLQMVQTAHRFGIRIYFDNIMNHRGFDVPAYNSSTPTNLYPGLSPQDFHLQTVSGGHYVNWPSVQNFNNQWEVQNQPLSGLIDLANEPGSINDNFGATLGSTIPKVIYIRQPNNPDYYMDTNGISLGGPWHPFNGTNGQPVAEDVNAYLVRAAMWTLYVTKCDGFRLDAVKHVPSGFFGDASTSWNGYTGGIQAMYDYTHGYGANVTGNGYVEPDDSRNSCFDSEAPRNDALLFGEHLGEPPTFSEYLTRGMRLLNTPLANQLNSILGNPNSSLSGLDQRDYRPYADAFTGPQSVMFAQSQDNGFANHRDLQNAYYFTHEGIPEIYSDGYNQTQAPQGQTPFPRIANANYLGEFGDNMMPELCYLHNQMSRGGTLSRWSDNDIVAYERYDYREGTNSSPQNQDVMLFAMDDNYGFPGDISFDDGVARTYDGYYGVSPSNSRGVGLVVGFPPGSVLSQMAQSSSGANRAPAKLLVHQATSSLAQAQATANDPIPANRMIYVGGQSLASGGGAVELLIPSGGYVMYGYQWPEASRASLKDAISLKQGGVDAPRLTIYRQDGTNGDTGFNPLYPFKMRGSVDQSGNVLTGSNVSNLTYAIDIPIVTNAPFDIILRNDASSGSALIKLDGGTDINSQMGLGATNGTDLRDNRPGVATDVFLGYEQTLAQLQNGPEKFAARNIASNNIVSSGAETYYYTVGGAITVVSGSGFGVGITNQTANWVFHDPTNTVTALGTVPASQRFPQSPAAGQSVDLWIKVGYQFQINTCFIYFTTDGSNPEGSFGVGKGTTQVVQGTFANHDSVSSNIDWWKGTIPAQSNGAQVRYKVALFNKGIQPIPDAEASGSKLYGLAQYAITNFNPTTALVWLHNDLNTNNTTVGLQEGFHIVRARSFLSRAGKSSVYNTFLQTFYYDAQLPTGVIAFPTSDGTTISNSTYTFVVRADTTTTSVEYNISDSAASNDDAVTGLHNGDGLTNGVPVFVQAPLVNPDPTLDQQYPTQPQEYRFNYAAVPGSGTATITVHLKKLTTSVYTNRFTTLTRTVNTAGPSQILQISAPAVDGQTLFLKTNDTYNIQTCFSQSLDTNNATWFSIYINGVFQPRQATNGGPLYLITGSGCGAGMRTLSYQWTGATAGTNTIQVLFNSGSVSLSDTRTFNVVNPVFNITSISASASGGLIVWDSVPNQNYQVWATTNLNVPMAPISGVIPASNTSTYFFDPVPDPTNKFYRIVLLP
ncbi:MAG: hypothetical protein JWR26_4227 [Pedosphaera sp.]|nr:hypothetical protein [Pedosphaera sp.]